MDKFLSSPHTSRLLRCVRQPMAAADILGQPTDNKRKRPNSGPEGPRKKRAKDDDAAAYQHAYYDRKATAIGREPLFKTALQCVDSSAFEPIDLASIDPPQCMYRRHAVIFNCLFAQAESIYDPISFHSRLNELRIRGARGGKATVNTVQHASHEITSAGRRIPNLHTVNLTDEIPTNTKGHSSRKVKAIHDEDQVSTLLREGVEQPIVVLGKPARYKPTVEEFCRVYEDWRDADGHPFELHKQRGSKKHNEGLDTEIVPVDDMLDELSRPSREGAASTFLSLPNLTNICWTPSFIQQHDLLYHIHLQTGEAHQYRFDEFAVAGSDQSLTTPHVDKLGASTWVAPVVGGKLWGFLAGSPEQRRRTYAMTDFNITGASDEQDFPSFGTHWVNLAGQLDPVLIMPPGEPHFVMGCGENLCVGGHLYQKERLDQTWRAMTSELFDDGHSNELHAPRNFEKLTLIVKHHFGPLFDDRDRAASCPELRQLVKRYREWEAQGRSPPLGGQTYDEPTLAAVEAFMSAAAATVERAGFDRV